MWSLNSPDIQNLAPMSMIVGEVLYYYDGPVIFTSRVGLFETLCLKVDEIDQDGLYLVAAISMRMLESLKAGRISVRGAMWQKEYHLVQASPNFQVRRVWQVDQSQLPMDMLPEAGAGLHTHHGRVVDTVDQINAFFALRFAGDGLQPGRMAFSIFKGLIDESYELVRSAFAPPSIAKHHSLFDFNISEPVFSSLVVSIQEPTLNKAGFQRANSRRRDSVEITSESAQFEIENRRQQFFQNVEEVVSITRVGAMSQLEAEQHFYTLDNINEVIPTQKNGLNSVEFSANSLGFSNSIWVDDRLGERLREAHRHAEFMPVNDSGEIIELNAESSTVILRNQNGRQFTCLIKRETFERMSDLGELVIGRSLAVAGKKKRRKRRDFLSVDRDPIVLAQRRPT